MREDGYALVGFVQSWDSRDFRASRVGDPPTGRLRHAWRFGVSPTGLVTGLGRGGNVTPAEIP